jgi:hypothetical protein
MEPPMRAGRWSPMLFAVFVLLAAAQTAFGNAIAPTVYFFPGVIPFMFGMAVPASVLAAFLERPFVTWAGVREHTLWYSLQANLVSLLIGYVTLPVGMTAIYTIGPLWSLIAVAMSVVSERCYYQWRAREDSKVRWWPIVLANVFSSFVLLVLPSIGLMIKEGFPHLELELAPYQHVLLWGSVGGGAVLFAASFFVPSLLRRKAEAHQALQATGAAIQVSQKVDSLEVAPAAQVQ